jgi:Phosphodiester glycosidase
MTGVPVRRAIGVALCLVVLAGGSVALTACDAWKPATAASPRTTPERTATAARGRIASRVSSRGQLPTPAALVPFGTSGGLGAGTWRPAGLHVDGVPAVYETTLVPPGGTRAAGIAWMDTALLSARLYSGSKSPGGGPYRYSAPIQPAQAASLVAAFNGGFKMADAHGGYYTEGRLIDPLISGAASLVIYASGRVTVGAWGTDVRMAPDVVAVRQNLLPLVADGQPTALAASADWQAWGNTCGASSCAASVPGIEHQWRSGAGVTADGALVYVVGPGLDPLQLAQLLVRAGVVRGMQLDINPSWPVFASYAPANPRGLAAPSNGSKLLAATKQGPRTFFEPWWARDFITMSTRPAVPGGP